MARIEIRILNHNKIPTHLNQFSRSKPGIDDSSCTIPHSTFLLAVSFSAEDDRYSVNPPKYPALPNS